MFLLELKFSRREFLATSAKLAALFGLQNSAIGQISQSLEQIEAGGAPVLWLQGQSCSGCSISLLNTYPRSIVQFLTNDIQLKFHQTLSTATGKLAKKAADEVIDQGNYFLVVEGAIPVGLPDACRFAHENFDDQLRRAIPRSRAVIAVGACAAYGGIPGAEGNPTGAKCLREFMKKEGFRVPLIAIPGCPPHPDWIVGTITHVLKFGLPSMDKDSRPLMFFRRTIHEQCPRFSYWERKHFAQNFGDEGCLFKIGCQGPITHADCTIRKWNNGVNDCIESGGACTGCTSPDYPRKKDFPFYYEIGRRNSNSSLLAS
ncbi:MAG: hydrogenase small subunit [Chthoniobacterales bacterium]|nr:hydrogenase small subunit [Chthoniobacterales bacterium]